MKQTVSRRGALALLVGGLALTPVRASQPGTLRVSHWARQVMRLVVKYQQNPLRAARALSYVQVAFRDGWAGLPATDPAAAELAGHRAASLMAEQLYPHETPGQFEAQFALLAQALGLPSGRTATALLHGTRAGRALVDRSLRDGSGRVWSPRGRPADFPGIWQPTWPMYAANPTEGHAPQWRTWVPRPPGRYDPPPAFRPGSAGHARETQEVLAVSHQLTDAQRQAAQAWNLDAGSVTPAGVWVQLALDELQAHGADTALTGTVLAAVTTCMHDAFVECWRVKLRDWSERPVTAVRRDLDASFAPLLVTPGFPSYVSGHSTVSAAAATVLSHFWPAQSGRYHAMAQEAALSRLWGGIHFTSDNEQGLLLGNAVGRDAVAQLG